MDIYLASLGEALNPTSGVNYNRERGARADADYYECFGKDAPFHGLFRSALGAARGCRVVVIWLLRQVRAALSWSAPTHHA